MSRPAEPLPTRRDHGPFAPPAQLAQLRQEEPLSRMSYPGGHLGWLVTSHALACAILADPRFSAAQELRRAVIPRPVVPREPPPPALPGMFGGLHAEEHRRYRRLLAPFFSARQARLRVPRIRDIADELVNRMRDAGPPADLLEDFAVPFALRVLCEVVGVPDADREQVGHDSALLFRQQGTAEQIAESFTGIYGYLHELVAAKRARPSDDVLGHLVAGTGLSDPEVAGVGFLLLAAGHDTPASMVALGTFALVTHLGRPSAVLAGPAALAAVVEELLRYLTIAQFGTTRTALSDVEMAGRLVAAGDTVTVSLPAANRDPARFADPDAFDLARPATGHLAFGYGVHQCPGRHLGRAELRVAFQTLFRRLPSLRLAVPAGEVPMRGDSTVHGVRHLPVTW
ncbi:MULTISPECIES: cytochrome P450 [unclassified Amycolatopsis]|uniref:cytochrome P450 n=1 Tax=unclassified Amycolatopsis TaxID=2618356 RepID=UPI00287BAA09|nr:MULTISPECIES: cytochrome P450 [unclassified Amycolatopsis]